MVTGQVKATVASKLIQHVIEETEPRLTPTVVPEPSRSRRQPQTLVSLVIRSLLRAARSNCHLGRLQVRRRPKRVLALWQSSAFKYVSEGIEKPTIFLGGSNRYTKTTFETFPA